LSRAVSPVSGKPYGQAAVCRVWGLARSTVYRLWRRRERPPAAAPGAGRSRSPRRRSRLDAGSVRGGRHPRRPIHDDRRPSGDGLPATVGEAGACSSPSTSARPCASHPRAHAPLRAGVRSASRRFGASPKGSPAACPSGRRSHTWPTTSRRAALPRVSRELPGVRRDAGGEIGCAERSSARSRRTCSGCGPSTPSRTAPGAARFRENLQRDRLIERRLRARPPPSGTSSFHRRPCPA
jgi:hypothetical protein